MQAAKIKIGEDYAVENGARVVALRVYEKITKTDGKGSANYFNGWYDASEGERLRMEMVPAERFVAPLAEHEAAMKEKQRLQDARDQAEAGKRALQTKAGTMLAKAIGATFAEDRYAKGLDRNSALVLRDYNSSISINEEAWPALINFLEEAVDSGINPVESADV